MCTAHALQMNMNEQYDIILAIFASAYVVAINRPIYVVILFNKHFGLHSFYNNKNRD